MDGARFHQATDWWLAVGLAFLLEHEQALTCHSSKSVLRRDIRVVCKLFGQLTYRLVLNEARGHFRLLCYCECSQCCCVCCCCCSCCCCCCCCCCCSCCCFCCSR